MGGRRTGMKLGGLRIALLAALVAACGEPSPSSKASGGGSGDAVMSLGPGHVAGDLFGEWRVTALESPDLEAPPQAGGYGDPRQVVMLFGARGVEAASQCVPYAFEHRREQEKVEVTVRPWPEPVCGRALLPYEAVFGPLMDGVTRVNAAPSGGVRLSGPAGAVTLDRPPGGVVANPFGNNPFPGPDLLWGHFRLVTVAGVAPEPGHPIDVAIGSWWIEAKSGCLPFRWLMVRSDANLTLREGPPEVRCQRGISEAERALEDVMPTVRRFDWAAPYRVRLSGPAGSVVLVRVHPDGQPAG